VHPNDTRASDPLEDERLISTGKAAALLGVSRSTIYRLLSRSELPSTLVGRSRRIPFGAVASYLRCGAADR
jgi:excisionase family DNA binding protein